VTPSSEEKTDVVQTFSALTYGTGSTVASGFCKQ
jgi:hypothetical protein